ncbi:LptF/LptG family permease [Desulfoplanes formicivorans]|uniref:Permease n=1 Tax=Desulfoplanes formicivorans TaxID=1592317 RepID=A0A194AL99_9BACT|nr:LptF/LptG family permease [Desulfoplanes formicivorans]GAU09811.1 permease [Desulfoplanes formicivorans]
MNNNILVRYLIRQNLFLLALVFGAGIGIYLLIELFDRLDDFLKAGVGLSTIVMYFAAKTPLIISQIFPAVFLLSLLIQFSLMHRNREIIALTSCAVPFAVIGRTIVVYALVWSALLFGFSQVLGTKGYSVAHRIWKEDVRKKQLSQQVLYNVWFREENRIIRIRSFKPFQGVGRGAAVYALSGDGNKVEQIAEAKGVEVHGNTWTFMEVNHLHIQSFSRRWEDRMDLILKTDPRSFATLESEKAPQYLSYWNLSRVIKGLGQAGSNVEGLVTALHAKISYPVSLLVMACAAIALTLAVTNVYLSVLAGLVLVFAYYAIFVMSTAAGENGLLPPFVAAWMPNAVFGLGFLGMLAVSVLKKEKPI